jgi:hypothetical protein
MPRLLPSSGPRSPPRPGSLRQYRHSRWVGLGALLPAARGTPPCPNTVALSSRHRTECPLHVGCKNEPRHVASSHRSACTRA